MQPVPAPQHVVDFQALYERKWGVALSGEEAHKTLTDLMQFVYLRDLYLFNPEKNDDTG